MKKILTLAAACLLMSEAAMAFEAGKKRYEECAACHGSNGLNKALGISIKIGDLDDPAKVEALLNYMKNDGQGKNTTMVNMAKKLSKKEIKDLSAYIGTL